MASIPIAAGMLGVTAYWFGWANRYVVFLYYHLGAQPFDTVTSSRYWMAGLVASGMVLTGFVAWCWVRGRLAARRGRAWTPPAWWRIWLVSAVPVGAGVIAITMTAGAPLLPLPLALACAAATVVGLAAALSPCRMAAREPLALVWLAADGAVLMPPLLILHVLLPEMRDLPGTATAVAFAAASVLAAVIGLAVMTALRAWRARDVPSPGALLAAGLSESYVLLPLLHYLLSDPGGPYYISTASNFFPESALSQAVIVAFVAGLAYGCTSIRRRLARTAAPFPHRA